MHNDKSYQLFLSAYFAGIEFTSRKMLNATLNFIAKDHAFHYKRLLGTRKHLRARDQEHLDMLVAGDFFCIGSSTFVLAWLQ